MGKQIHQSWIHIGYEFLTLGIRNAHVDSASLVTTRMSDSRMSNIYPTWKRMWIFLLSSVNSQRFPYGSRDFTVQNKYYCDYILYSHALCTIGLRNKENVMLCYVRFKRFPVKVRKASWVSVKRSENIVNLKKKRSERIVNIREPLV